MRVKVEYRSASREVYNKFCSAHPTITISFADWKKIIYTYNELFRDTILETGDKLKMPNGLGHFTINKKKLKTYKNFKNKDGKPYVNLRIDWKRTKETGKRVYHLNKHTDGFNYHWYWIAKDARFFLAEIWNFGACREASRLLGSYLTRPNSLHAQMYKTWKKKK